MISSARCVLCILTPEILDTVYVRGRLPRTIELFVVLHLPSSAHCSCSLLLFPLALRLSVNSKFPLCSIFILPYYIINTFIITLSFRSAHMRRGGQTVPYISNLSKTSSPQWQGKRIFAFKFAIYLSLLTPITHLFHRTSWVYSTLYWCAGNFIAYQYQSFGASRFHRHQNYFFPRPLTQCTIHF